MERREFLKLGAILTSGFLASKIPGYEILNSDNVFLFTIVDESGKRQIIASRCGISKLVSSSWKYMSFDKESFTYLETIPNCSTEEGANRVRERKKHWFEHYGIEVKNKRMIGFSPGSVKGGKKAASVNKEKGNLSITASYAGRINGKKTIDAVRQKYLDALQDPEKRKVICKSHSDRMKRLKQDPEFNRRTREAHANSPAKKRSELENIKHATVASINSPNRFVKQRWICPDGFETHGPGRFQYCKNRGLDVTKCVLKPINMDGVELTDLKRPGNSRSLESFNNLNKA